MSDDLITTKPVVFFRGIAAGNYLFDEYLIRPSDYPTLFPQGEPTFPDLPAALDHRAWPPSPSYAKLSASTAIPFVYDPATSWIAPMDLFLFKISTDTWARGDQVWTLETARLQQRRLIYREQIASAADIPENDGWYGYLYNDPTHYAVIPEAHFASSLMGFSPVTIYKDWTTAAADIVTTVPGPTPPPPVNHETAQNEFLWLLNTEQQPGDYTLLNYGTPQKTQIIYEGILPVTFALNPVYSSLETRWVIPEQPPSTTIRRLQIRVWVTEEPLDGFVVGSEPTPPTKKRGGSIVPALTALGLLWGLLLCSGNGAPVAGRRKRQIA